MKNKNIKNDIWVEDIIRKYIKGYDIVVACENLIKQIDNDKNPENAKTNKIKRRRLEKCVNLLSNPYIQQKIEELQKIEQPSDISEFIQLILITYADEIIEHDKRQYDFSDKYTGKRIKKITEPDGTVRKDISFQETPKEETKPEANEETNDSPKKNPYVLPLGDGDSIIFTNIGKLTFNTFSSEESKTVNKFEITFKASNGNQRTDIVFTNINFLKLSDKAYLRAVLEELLSKKNIEHSNCGGYIGEIRPSINGIDKIKIGEQVNSSELYLHSCTRYRFSKKYELIYDFDTLEAVMDYVREQEKQKKEQEQQQHARQRESATPQWLKDYMDER